MLYFVNEALRGLFQAKLMTFVSIITVAVSLTIVGTAVVCTDNVQALFTRVSQRVDMVAYLDDGYARDSAAGVIRGRIASLGVAGSVAYVGKDSAWSRFSVRYGASMLNSVDSNPLPASLEISLLPQARTSSGAQLAMEQIRAIPGVESVTFSSEWFSRLERVRWYITVGSLVVGIACLVVLYFVVSNTIKLTIYARRELIATMRVVGATNHYIRMPFILEGMLQGALGALIAVAAVVFLESVIRPYLLTAGPRFLLPGLVALGVVFGWLGSASAVRKFLA